jgi:hypothetical protein
MTRSKSERGPTVCRQHDIPEGIRALDTLTSPDYVDLFAATTSDAIDTSPEGWARAAFEDAPPVRRFLAFRVLLGLRLAPSHSPDHVAGWRIADRGDGWIRLEARSWFMTAHCVFHVDEGRVSFATFVRYDRWMGALVWPAVSIIHRRAAVLVLRRAVRLNRRHKIPRREIDRQEARHA